MCLSSAVFQLTVRHSPILKVLSNTAVQWTKVDEGGMTITHFKQTPPMSSYLLALAAGEKLLGINRYNIQIPTIFSPFEIELFSL